MNDRQAFNNVTSPEVFQRNYNTPDELVPKNDETNPGMIKTFYDSAKLSAADGLYRSSQFAETVAEEAPESPILFPKADEQRAAMTQKLKENVDNVHTQVDDELSNPDIPWYQRYTNAVGSMIGGLTNIPALAAGGIGGAIADVGASLFVSGAERVLPSAVEKVAGSGLSEGTKSALSKVGLGRLSDVTLGGAAENAAVGFGAGAGAALPETLQDDVDETTGKYQIGKIVGDLAASGAFGVSVGAQAYLIGHLLFGKNVSRRTQTDEEKEFLANPTNEKASAILTKRGISVNTATHEVPIEIVPKDDVENMQSGIYHQLNSAMKDVDTTLSDFLISKGLDKLTDDSNSIDGLRGFVAHVDERLARRDEILKPLDEQIEKQTGMFLPDEVKTEIENIKNKLLPDKTFYRGFKDDIAHGLIDDPVFGKGYWMTTIKSYAEGYGQNLETFKGNPKLYDIKNGNDKNINSIFAKVKKTLSKILDKSNSGSKKALHAKLKKLKAELHKEVKAKGYDGMTKHIETFLFDRPTKQSSSLPSKVKSSFEYKRLKELSKNSINAKMIKNRIDLEDQLNKEDAFANVARHIIDIADNKENPIADPNAVFDSLQKNINDTFQPLDKTVEEELHAKVEDMKTVPENTPELVNANDELLKSEDMTKEIKSGYDTSKNRFQEFKSKPNVFSNLIKCILGAST